MSVFSWNIRGLGGRPKRSALRKHIASINPSFVFVQETKMENISLKIIRSIWNMDEIEWIFSPSIGNSGGILSLWNSSLFEKESSITNRHWTAIKGTFTSPKFECILINIYNSCLAATRVDVWKEITDYWSRHSLPCLIIGDFNDVLKASERGSLTASQPEIDNFRNFIQDMHLLEIPSSTRGFTWFRGNSKSLLDRCFINPEWLTLFSGLRVTLLKRGLSDHCPLHVHNEIKNWGPKPFRFQNCWLTDPNCLKIIKEAWLASSSSPMNEKLKAVRKRLKIWNRDDFGNIESNILQLENAIQNLDDISNQRVLTTDELEEKKSSATRSMEVDEKERIVLGSKFKNLMVKRW